MGLYRDHVLPRLVDRACRSEGLQPWRAEVTSGLVGRVVEIGFGSGLNVEHHPPEVEMVLAVEPAELARRLAAKRAGAGGVPVRHIGLDDQAVALPDASCDAALSTFTLCTVAAQMVPWGVCVQLSVVPNVAGRLGKGAVLTSSRPSALSLPLNGANAAPHRSRRAVWLSPGPTGERLDVGPRRLLRASRQR
jgi:hypothetical protein